MDALAKLPVYDKYKRTRVKWLEEVPSHWDEYPICSKAKLKSITNKVGEDLLSVYLDKGVIRFDEVEQKRTNVTSLDLSKYQLVEVGDFVLNNQQAWRGSVGVSSYRGIVSPAYLVLSLAQDLLPNFANYLFRDGGMVSHYLISSKGVGTIQRNLYWPQLKRAPLFIPPVEEQISIASFLDAKTAQIDEAIVIKEKQIALLKERKQIIIQTAVTQGLNTDVPMKNSGVDWIGEVPSHWELKRLKYVTRIVKRIIGFEGPSVLSITQKGIKIKDIESGEGQLAMDYSKYQIVEAGNFAMNHMDLLTGYVDISKYDGVISPDYRVFVNTYYGLDDEFLLAIFQLGYQQKIFYRYGQGVSLLGRWRFPADNFNNFFIPIPPKEEQVSIVNYVRAEWDKVDKAIALLLSQIEKLKEYKTTLINSAVTGKIKVA